MTEHFEFASLKLFNVEIVEANNGFILTGLNETEAATLRNFTGRAATITADITVEPNDVKQMS